MKVTLDLRDTDVALLMQATGAATLREAVVIAMLAYLESQGVVPETRSGISSITDAPLLDSTPERP